MIDQKFIDSNIDRLIKFFESYEPKEENIYLNKAECVFNQQIFINTSLMRIRKYKSEKNIIYYTEAFNLFRFYWALAKRDPHNNINPGS